MSIARQVASASGGSTGLRRRVYLKTGSLFRHAVLFAALVVFGAAGASASNLSYSIDGIQVSGRGDSLSVRVAWSFRDWNVEPGRAMVYSLVLKHGDSSVALTPVSVYGRKAAKDAVRIVASGRRDECAVVDVSSPVKVIVEDMFPYREWMDTVKVLLYVSEWSRGGGLSLRSSAQKACYAKPGRPAVFGFEWEVAAPERFSGAWRSFCFEVPVEFEEGSSKFDIDYGSNRKAVSSLLPKLRSLTLTKRFQLRDAGFRLSVRPSEAVSAGGTAAGGKTRLQSFYAYLQRSGAVSPAASLARTYDGADWTGVAEWLRESRHQRDFRLMEILSMDATMEEKGAVIRREKPGVWEELCTELFPSLGRVTFCGEYRPVRFSDPRFVVPVFKEIPEMLTPWDFWFLSTQYEKGSDEWLDVMLTGASLNPGCEELNRNAAHALIERNAPRQATEYVRNCGDSLEGKYVFALWFYSLGRYDECVELLKYLADRGDFYLSVYENAVPFIDWSTNHVAWRKVNL